MKIKTIHEKDNQVRVVVEVNGVEKTHTIPKSGYSDKYLKYLKRHYEAQNTGWADKDKHLWGTEITD